MEGSFTVKTYQRIKAYGENLPCKTYGIYRGSVLGGGQAEIPGTKMRVLYIRTNLSRDSPAMHISGKLACVSLTQVVIQDLADAVMLVVTEYVCVVEELVSVEVVLPRQISAMLLFAMAFPEYKSHCTLRMQRNSARSMRRKRPTRSQHNGREDRVSAYRA